MDTRRSSSRSTARPGLSILHGTSLRAMAVRIFLLDDHEVVRRGVRELLEVEDDLEIVGEAGTAEEALARIPATAPDVAIIDMRLPDGNGVEVCSEVRSRTTEVSCVVL